jgi:aspartate/methionine/tyrosine aminotransferase
MTAVEGRQTDDVGYPMRQWVFDDALGRYDIDLGDSHVECGTVADLTVPADLELNYGVDRGGARLRELVAARYGGSADSVLVTHGAQEALFLAYSVLLRPGDQVITFRPGWQQSWDAPPLMGARVDVLDLDREFAIDIAAVAAAATDRLRIIVVNSPGNPTGRTVGAAELAALRDIVARTDGYLLLDEEYAVDLTTSPAVRDDRVLSVSSLSKVYGLPGLRIGWLYTHPSLAVACARRKHLTSIANSVLTEALAADVLAHAADYIDRYHQLTGPGLEMVRTWCAVHADRVALVPPQGTPFAWLWLSSPSGPSDSLAFCRQVLERGVLLMPGETTGATGGFRLSFAREPAVLDEGLRRIGAVLRGDPAGRPPIASPPELFDDRRSTDGVAR